MRVLVAGKLYETTGWRGILELTFLRFWLKNHRPGDYVKCFSTGAVYKLTDQKRGHHPVWRVIVGNGWYVSPGEHVTLPSLALVKPLFPKSSIRFSTNGRFASTVKTWVKKNGPGAFCKSDNTGLVFQYTGHERQFVLIFVPQRYARVDYYQRMLGNPIILEDSYCVQKVTPTKIK